VTVVVGIFQPADDGLGRPDPASQILLAQVRRDAQGFAGSHLELGSIESSSHFRGMAATRRDAVYERISVLGGSCQLSVRSSQHRIRVHRRSSAVPKP
jgi:hypothetical protein